MTDRNVAELELGERADKHRRGSARAAGLSPLVAAKLAIPRVRDGLVHRPRVRRALNDRRDTSLTLVAAPAGHGKTTEVRAWCAELDAALAWVTLDASDNDPVVFWRYVATAVDRVRSGLGRRALRLLDEASDPIELVVDALMDAVAVLEGELVIVLDDLQAVVSEECLSSVDYVVGRLPPNVHLVLLTRVDPALRLPRLRAAGALVEVRGADLAFTNAEAHELLVGLGHLELGAEEIDALVERTEGWPAALVLAWLWLRTAEDPARAVLAFRGDHRFVADYLSREVLAALDEDSRALLHGAAVLGEFTAELCDGVLDRTDSAARLDELADSNLFVLRLEQGEWFRVHSLFADYASAQLARFDPHAPTSIHRRAAVWLRSRGLPVESVEHAAKAGDDELVADVLSECHLNLIRTGASRTLLRWVRTLPEDRIVGHPELAVAAGTAAMLVGGSTLERRRLLALADESRGGRPEQPDAYVEAAALMVRAVTIDGGVRQAVLDGRRAVSLAEAGASEILTATLAATAHALFFAGELDDAWTAAMRTLEQPAIERAVPSRVIARSTLALVAAMRGRLSSAREHAEKAKAATGQIGSSRGWLGANASAALGAVLAAQGTVIEAEHELSFAERFFTDELATVHHTWLLVLLARVRLRRGRLEQAEATLRSAREALRELSDSGLVSTLAEAVGRELEAASDRAAGGEVLEPPSEAEHAVLSLLVSDLSVREIGERLFLSQNTIRSHRRALYQKLGVHSRADAVARATAVGLLEQTQSG